MCSHEVRHYSEDQQNYEGGALQKGGELEAFPIAGELLILIVPVVGLGLGEPRHRTRLEVLRFLPTGGRGLRRFFFFVFLVLIQRESFVY